MRFLSVIIVTITAAAVVAGCGGGSSTSATPSSPASGATAPPPSTSGSSAAPPVSTSGSSAAVAYRKQASAICTQTNKQGASLQPPQSASDVKPFLSKTVGLLRGELGKLRGLKPPAQLSGKVSKALTAKTKAVQAVQGVLKKVAGGTDPKQAVQAAEGSITMRNATAKKAFTDAGIPGWG